MSKRKKHKNKRKRKRKRFEMTDSDEEYIPISSNLEESSIDSEIDQLTHDLKQLNKYKLSTDEDKVIINNDRPPTKKRKKIDDKYSFCTGGGYSTKKKALKTLQFIRGRNIKFSVGLIRGFLCCSRGLLKRTQNQSKIFEINSAINIFENWLNEYNLNKDTIDSFDYLSLNIMQKYEILTDFYNTKNRKNIEIKYNGIINKNNTFNVNKIFLNIFRKFDGDIRGLRVTKNNDIKSNWNSNCDADLTLDIIRNNKLLELKKELIQYDIRCNGKIKNIDDSVLFYCRGKLKGLPSRIHCQMIMCGYSPRKQLIIKLAPRIQKMLEKIK